MFISGTEKEKIRIEISLLSARMQKLESYVQETMSTLKNYLEETSRGLDHPAPYGYCKNGQPKKKPGRKAK